MNLRILLLLLTSTCSVINCHNAASSNLLLYPWLSPPSAKTFLKVKNSSQNVKSNKNIKSKGRSATVQAHSKKSVQTSLKASSKEDESFFSSVWNSFLKLFSLSDKTDRTQEKSSKSKSNKTSRQPVTKRQQIVRKKPTVSKQKKPTSVTSKKHQLPSKHSTKPSGNQRFVIHNKNKNQGNVNKQQRGNRPANTNHVPNKSEMKQLVVRLHNTVSKILKHQQNNQVNTKQINNSNKTSKLRKPINGVNKIAHKVSGNNQVVKISSSKPNISNVPSKCNNNIIHNQKPLVKQKFEQITKKNMDQSMFQTSFSTTRRKKKVENVYNDNEFRPFVPNFLTLESGVGHDNKKVELDVSVVNTDKTAVEIVGNVKEAGDDAYKASHRTIDDGADVVRKFNQIDHEEEECSQPVSNCYEKLLDTKIVQLQQEMRMLEEKYWGNKIK